MPDDDDDSDEALMRGLAEGRDRLLAELIFRWERPLYSFVFRYVQNDSDTRDIVQETFVRVYQKRALFRAGGRFSSWILSIAANLCRNRFRWRKRHAALTLDAISADGHASSEAAEVVAPENPHAEVVRAESVAAVRLAVNQLPHDLKTTFILFEYEGRSYREIATILHCSERGIEMRLYRARKRLHELLRPFLAAGD